MRPVHPGLVDDRVAELAGRGRRFVLEHIETDPEPALADRGSQRVVIDDLAARGVDDEAPGLEARQHVRVDESARLRAEREMDAEDVAARGDVRRRGGEM